jgi:hypothetical protein
MILLSTALAAVSGGADIRPWTVEGRIALPEEAQVARFGSETGLLVDTSRDVTREVLGALPNTSPVWVSEEEAGVPLLHYRKREADGAIRERPWPRASSGAPDYLAVIRETGLRFVAARSQSSLLLAWTDDFDLRGLCTLDTVQLSHAPSGTWRFVAETDAAGGTLYLLPARDGAFDPDAVGFAVHLPRPTTAAFPACTAERIVTAGHDPALEPTRDFRIRAPLELALGVDTSAAFGTAGPRGELAVNAGIGPGTLSVGYDAGDQGVAGRWNGRLGVSLTDPESWSIDGSSAAGIGLREHVYTERPVPSLWARRDVRFGLLGVSALSEATVAADTVFIAGFRFEQEVAVGIALGRDRTASLQALGGLGVAAAGVEAWGGLRLTGSTRLFDRPDWALRARRLRAEAS